MEFDTKRNQSSNMRVSMWLTVKRITMDFMPS